MRWGDMDAFQHVNNVVYFAYLEEARVAMLFVDGAEQGMANLGKGSVVARHEIDYRAPLVYHPRGVDIDTWVSRIGGSSFEVAYSVHDEVREFARAKTVVVPYDLAAARPRRLEPEERAFLQRFMDEELETAEPPPR